MYVIIVHKLVKIMIDCLDMMEKVSWNFVPVVGTRTS